MPFTTIDDVRASDLILEENVHGYYSRDTIYVNPTTTGTYKMGTVLWRVKAVDDSAVWDVVDAAADLSIANEYAILLGDRNGIRSNEGVLLTNGTSTPVLALSRDARVKEALVKAIHQVGGFTANNFRDLKGLLRKNSGIKVEDSLVALA